MSAHEVSHQMLVGGYIVLALALLATLGLTGWLLARRLYRLAIGTWLLVVLVGGVVSFQVVHFFEHLLQLGYWFAHPAGPAWMTPWGRAAADGLAVLANYPGNMTLGMELLHLAGNWILFTGVVPMYLVLRSRVKERKAMRAASVAFWLQLVHIVEHVSLTSTYLLVGRSIGMSTLFGASYYLGDAWASSIRIWWHFLMNLVVTVAALLALRELRRAGLLTTPSVPASVDKAYEVPERKAAPIRQ